MKTGAVLRFFIIQFVLAASLFVWSQLTYAASTPTYSLEAADPLQFGPNKNVETLVIDVITYVLGFVGAGAFIAFLYGGALMIFSAGNPKRVGTGKNVMVYAVIGLATIFFSYAILTLFFSILKAGAGGQ